MKKYVLPIILCLIILLSSVSCATERHDLLYETTVDSITYCVRGTGSRAKQIVLKTDGEIIWSKKVKVSSAVGSMGGDYGFKVLDLDFDGHLDFMIANDTAGDETSYLCWIWDGTDYVQSDELTGLCNIQTDSEKKVIFAFSHSYTSEEAYLDAPASHISTDSTTKYKWSDGKLIPEIRASITYYSETNLYCYAVSYYDEETGKLGASDDKWLTPDEYKTYDMSFLYYFK